MYMFVSQEQPRLGDKREKRVQRCSDVFMTAALTHEKREEKQCEMKNKRFWNVYVAYSPLGSLSGGRADPSPLRSCLPNGRIS